MPYLQSTADLILDALRKAGEVPNNTSPRYFDALKHINTCQKDILAGGNKFDIDLCEAWMWAKAKYPGILTLQPAYVTGGVNLVLGSPNGSFTTPPPFDPTNQYLQQTGWQEMYRIVSYNAIAGSFVLDAPFSFESLTGAPFVLAQFDYDLIAGNLLRQIGPMRVYQTQSMDINHPGQIEGLDLKSFELRYPWNKMIQGVPTMFGYVYAVPGTYTVRFNKFPFFLTKVEYDYIPYPTADLIDDPASIPLVPEQHREILADYAAHKILVDKMDTKADYYMKMCKSGLKALVNDNRKLVTMTNSTAGQFFPRMDQFARNNWPTAEDDIS